MIRYLSFDLQGVLSDADFSDYFWLEQLPRLYAKKHHLALLEARTALRSEFTTFGKYNIHYYDDAFWGRQFGFTTLDVLRAMSLQPKLNPALLQFIETQSMPSIILSTTTMAFINYELGDKTQLFQEVFSCVDTFRVGGKTPAVFRKVAKTLSVHSDEILHIGDNPEMDISNARAAGVRVITYQGSAAQTIDAIMLTLKASAPRP